MTKAEKKAALKAWRIVLDHWRGSNKKNKRKILMAIRAIDAIKNGTYREEDYIKPDGWIE